MRISDWSSDVCSSDLLNQSSQISKAVEDYSSDRGRLPIEAGREPVEILVAEKYMKYAPEGGAAGWTLNSATKSLITPVSGSGDRASRVRSEERRVGTECVSTVRYRGPRVH